MKIGGGLIRVSLAFALVLGVLVVGSCSGNGKAAPTKTEITLDPGVSVVDHPELFPTARVTSRNLPVVVGASGVVAPDVNRTIHVTSQASGRVIDLKVRLGDSVHKGQELLAISSPDLAAAFSDYQKSLADERLAKKALERSQLLASHGALASKDLEQAEDAEEKARVDVENARQHVRILGGDPAHPSPEIRLSAPVDGTIVEQNVAGFEGIKSLDNSPNLFTIADLKQVWVLCDVYENDLGQLESGEPAEIRLSAYPGEVYRGRVTDISRVLDPSLRSAKVRIVLPNPKGSLRPGMYAVARFESRRLQPRLLVPSTAVMRLEDKDWVFRKQSQNQFRRLEVRALGLTADGFEALAGGVNSGEEVVADALNFSTAVAGQSK